MIIEAGEVPDSAVDALAEAMLEIEDGSRDSMRRALAAVLTAWENRPRDLMPLVAGHDCTWRTVGVQHRDALLGIKQTDVLQRCDGCGDVRSQILTGTWTMEQLRA